jgi:hypothetical protein
MKTAATSVLSCVLIGCGAPTTQGMRISSAVEMQLAAARNASIPAGITLADNSGPTRRGFLVLAEWSFGLRTDWDAYASEVMASFQRAGYEAVNRGPDSMAFANHVPGDSYRVRIARTDLASATRVTVSFSASPD